MNESFHGFVTGEKGSVVNTGSHTRMGDEDIGVHLQNAYIGSKDYRDQEQYNKWQTKASCSNWAWKHFPGGLVLKTLPSNAGGTGSIPGLGAKIQHASWPKHQNIKEAIL